MGSKWCRFKSEELLGSFSKNPESSLLSYSNIILDHVSTWVAHMKIIVEPDMRFSHEELLSLIPAAAQHEFILQQ